MKSDCIEKMMSVIEKGVRMQLEKLDDLLAHVPEDENDFIHKMKEACIYHTFIKRYANMIILTYSHTQIFSSELGLAVSETLEYIRMFGIKTYVEYRGEKILPSSQLLTAYSIFETVLEEILHNVSAVLVRVDISRDIIIKMEYNEVINDQSIRRLCQKIKTFGCEITVETDEKVSFITLVVPENASNSTIHEIISDQISVTGLGKGRGTAALYREMFQLKIKNHDDIGGALLAFRAYLCQSQEKRERGNLLELWKNARAIFKEKVHENSGDSWEMLIKTAKASDVVIDYRGKMPEKESLRTVLTAVCQECLLNTVKHAGGNRLYITISSSDNTIIAEIKNNGRPPVKEIKETGGLRNLRWMVENAGGMMHIDVLSGFMLQVRLPG